MLPDLATNWTTRPLGEVCDLIMGQAPKGTTYNDKGIGTPLIAGAADLGPRTPKPKKWTTASTKIGKQGDIILCVRATIGDLNWADKEYCYGRGVAGIRVNGQFDPKFVWYWLKACKEHLLSLGRGATFKQISKKDIANLPIPDLDIAEQRRIVARIKECMERVEEIEGLRTEAIEEAEATLPSLLNEAFVDLRKAYEKVEISDVAVETRYGTSRKCSTTPEGTAILRIPNVAAGFVNFDGLKYCSLDSKERNRIALQKGDLLFVRTNGSRDLVGRCAIYEGNGADCNHGFASYLIRVRLNQDKMRPHFLAFYLNSTHGRSELDKRRRTSAGQFNINSENLRNIEVPLPPVDVQDRIIEVLRDRQAQVNQLQSELRDAQETESHLRESILRKAFAGEL